METEPRRRRIDIIDVAVVIVILGFVALLVIPAPWPGPRSANRTKCMSNLMNISKVLKMYKLDYNEFPDTIAGYVQTDASGTVPFGKAKGGLHGVFGMKMNEVFYCPSSSSDSETAVVEVPKNGVICRYYALDDYDIYTPSDSGKRARLGPEALRYTKSWASSEAAVGKYPPSPPKTKDSAKLREEDYKRQLKWRDPPDDTVVTWCSNHRNKDVVLYLSGTARPVPRANVQASRWRTRVPPL